MVFRNFLLLACALLLIGGCSHGSDAVTSAPRTESKMPNGWKEISTSGFAIAFPPDWKAIDLAQADFEKATDAALAGTPSASQLKDQMKALAAQGIFKVFVFESKSIGTGFA